MVCAMPSTSAAQYPAAAAEQGLAAAAPDSALIASSCNAACMQQQAQGRARLNLERPLRARRDVVAPFGIRHGTRRRHLIRL